MVRFRREGDDQVEIQPLPFLQILEALRLVTAEVDADLVERGDGEGIKLPVRTPAERA